MSRLLDRPICVPRPRADASLRASSRRRILDFPAVCLAGAVRRVLQPGLCPSGRPGRVSPAPLQTILDASDRFVLVYSA